MAYVKVKVLKFTIDYLPDGKPYPTHVEELTQFVPASTVAKRYLK